ncbi:extracellular calcium-sensing receptor-like [Lissotriton helveticus]
MAFTVNEINREQKLLPNATLGFHLYDTCLSIERLLKGSMWMLTGKQEPTPNYRCRSQPPLSAIVGDSTSTRSIPMARLLGLSRQPQVSYYATSPLLSDKLQFPSFFRTIPSQRTHALGIAQFFLYYMKNVRFKNRFGDDISFDSNGDPPALYTIFNLQVGAGGAPHSVIVGSFDVEAPAGQQLHVNQSAIRWNMQKTEVPHSACSESCAPGYRKAVQNGRPTCCFDCILCAEGEISNETDSENCFRCLDDQWPNEKRTACVPKVIEYLSYQEPLGVALSAIVTFSSFLTTAIWITFFKNRHTPVVKANNRELSYLLLGGILLCFLCCLLFIGEPQEITCLWRQPAFGVLFIFCVSCVLSKTIMVVIAFNATKPSSNMRKWLGPRVPMVTVSGCTFLQVLICAIWLLNCPPFPEKNMKLRTGIIIFQCNECSKTAFWCMLGGMGVLACASFVVAFLARKLPDNFNEAKWITFSMLVFLSVWLSFIPGYLSTQGKHMVAVEVFGILSSSAGLLTCIFFPKCFIIILRPEMNTRRHLFGKGDRKTQKMKAI